MSTEAEETSLIQPIATLPALYKFNFFTDTGNRLRCKLPDDIAGWCWHSVAELTEVCKHSIARQQYQAEKEDPGQQVPDWTFDLLNYVSLNAKSYGDPLRLCWFVAHGMGYCSGFREPIACPINDPCVYVPALFGQRLIKAVKTGVKGAQWKNSGRGGELVGHHWLNGSEVHLAPFLN